MTMNIHARFTRIATRAGPYSRDHQEHCNNTVDMMGTEADEALVELREGDLEAVVEYLLGATDDGVEARLRAWINGEVKL